MPARSVPLRLKTLYCSSDSAARHSASLLLLASSAAMTGTDDGECCFACSNAVAGQQQRSPSEVAKVPHRASSHTLHLPELMWRVDPTGSSQISTQRCSNSRHRVGIDSRRWIAVGRSSRQRRRRTKIPVHKIHSIKFWCTTWQISKRRSVARARHRSRTEQRQRRRGRAFLRRLSRRNFRNPGYLSRNPTHSLCISAGYTPHRAVRGKTGCQGWQFGAWKVAQV